MTEEQCDSLRTGEGQYPVNQSPPVGRSLNRLDAGGRAKQDAYRDVGGRECLEQILEPEPRKSVAASIQ